MKIGELVKVLQKLPQDCEIAILAASAYARPPIIQRVNASAWHPQSKSYGSCGLVSPHHAFLIRPAQDVIR